MLLSSLSTWLKFIYDAKFLLKKTSSKSQIKSVPKEDKELDNKLSIISTAAAKVSSIAVRGVQDVIKIQDGAPTTAKMARRAAKQFSTGTKIPLRIVTDVERSGRGAVTMMITRRNSDRLVAKDLKNIVARISNWAHNCDAAIREIVDQTNRAEGKYGRKSYRYKASVVTALTACGEVMRTVAKIVEAHSVMVGQTKEPVLSIKELLLGIHLLTAQAAFAATETVTVRDREKPPPYEKLV